MNPDPPEVAHAWDDTRDDNAIDEPVPNWTE